MKKFILVFFSILILMGMSFFALRNSYREWVKYSELIDRANIIALTFEELSGNINKAAVVNPDFLSQGKLSPAIHIFTTDSTLVFQKLEKLKATVRDSINIKIAAALDKQIRVELSWLIKSNVLDSIIHRKAKKHLAQLETIDMLIQQGKQRTYFILQDRKNNLQFAYYEAVTWIAILILLSFLMLAITFSNLVRQQSERKKKEKELENRETHFRQILDNMLEGVQIHDLNWKYIYVNNALSKYSRRPKEELIGKKLPEVFPGIEDSKVFETLERCMKERRSEQLETEFLYTDGRKADYELSIQPVPEGLFILSIDITERKKAEEKVTKVNRLYKFISNINKSIVHITDREELLTKACDIAKEIGGFKLAYFAELNDKNILNITHYCGNDSVVTTLLKRSELDCNNPLFKEIPSVKAVLTGRYHFNNDVQNDPDFSNSKENFTVNGIHASIALPIFKFGKVHGIFGLHASTKYFFDTDEIALLEEAAGDISFALENFDRAKKHHQTEELVIKNEKRFRSLIEKSTDLKTLTNIDGKLSYVSPSVIKTFGFSEKELLNVPGMNFFHPEDATELIRKRNEIIDKPGASYFFTFRVLHKDKRWIWCEGTVTNFLHEPAIQAMVSNFRNITEKKLIEEQREIFIKELTQNNKDLQQFAYITSHNMRGPVASLLGLTNLLENFKIQDPTLVQILAGIKKAGNNFDETIRDLNTILSVKDNLIVTTEKLNIEPSFLKTLEQCDTQILETGAEITYTFNAAEIIFNKSYLESILINLLSNALKYRDKSRRLKLNITTEFLGESVILKFTDNGIGIDVQQYHEKIFKLYQRFNTQIEGKGLGLFLIKSQLESLGGSISIKSELHKGTEFTLIFRNSL